MWQHWNVTKREEEGRKEGKKEEGWMDGCDGGKGRKQREEEGQDDKWEERRRIGGQRGQWMGGKRKRWKGRKNRKIDEERMGVGQKQGWKTGNKGFIMERREDGSR